MKTENNKEEAKQRQRTRAGRKKQWQVFLTTFASCRDHAFVSLLTAAGFDIELVLVRVSVTGSVRAGVCACVHASVCVCL